MQAAAQSATQILQQETQSTHQDVVQARKELVVAHWRLQNVMAARAMQSLI